MAVETSTPDSRAAVLRRPQHFTLLVEIDAWLKGDDFTMNNS